MTLPFGKTHSFAIYGGTFSPPHAGHLGVAKQALKDLPISTLIVLPTLHNPLKSEDYASFEHRYEMCRSMFFDSPSVLVSKFEQEFNMSGFMIDNLRKIREFYASARIWFIMGSDCLTTFNHWKAHEELASLVNIVIYPRTEQSSTQIRQLIQEKKFTEAEQMVGVNFIWDIMKGKELYGLKGEEQ